MTTFLNENKLYITNKRPKTEKKNVTGLRFEPTTNWDLIW